MSLDREDLIRKRAYEIWESEHRPHGRDKEHWDRAALEVAGEPASPPAKKVRKAVAKAAVAPAVKVAAPAAKAMPVAPVKLAAVAAKTVVKPKPKRV